MRSHILDGTVRHRRVRPFDYDLQHGVYYLALDLDELDEVDRRHRLLSRNRANVLGFRDDDHMAPPAKDLPGRIREHLAAEGWDPTDWRITLVTNPRVLGYVFNPASFYLCRDASGELAVVVVEVHNTHLERHLYTLTPRPDSGPVFQSSMDKTFYVSPFIEIHGGYTVRVRDEPESLRIAIDQGDAEGGLLYTSLSLRRRRLTDRMLVRMLIRHPFVTHKTMAMIHWHALKLWRRGATFHRHGEAAR
ncbi:MAG: DUF1365 domain-containing protein [Thermomicrobiales bacterium]|jgi:DUF1365 family protein|nr:MAG: DUF1365 domain-containing protein [Thermomicrobiales bacterium]